MGVLIMGGLLFGSPIWGFLKQTGALLSGFPITSKDHCILGSILGSHCLNQCS